MMEEKKAKVSVLITFYNQEKYVDDAIKSVMDQKTDFPFLIIAGDDGSSDGTVSKIKEWEGKYPDIISHIVMPRDPGKKYISASRASKNRLALLEKVETPYFIYLDGDDFWTSEEKLQRQVDILEKPENSDCVACGHKLSGFWEDHPEDTTSYPDFDLPERKIDLKTYLSKYYLSTDTLLFRSGYIKDIDTKLLTEDFNDTLITYSFMQFGKIYYLPDAMAVYRQLNGSIFMGAKSMVTVVRQIMGYDYAVKINPNMESLLRRRYYNVFSEAIERAAAFQDVNPEYLNIAKTYGLKTAEKYMSTGHLFSDSAAEDRRILKKIYFDKQVNRLYYHLK